VAELQAAATRAIFVGSASQRAVFILLPKLEVLGPSVGVFAYFVIVSNYRPFFATRAFPSVSLFPRACWHHLSKPCPRRLTSRNLQSSALPLRTPLTRCASPFLASRVAGLEDGRTCRGPTTSASSCSVPGNTKTCRAVLLCCHSKTGSPTAIFVIFSRCDQQTLFASGRLTLAVAQHFPPKTRRFIPLRDFHPSVPPNSSVSSKAVR
jgi:hypothetical protein